MREQFHYRAQIQREDGQVMEADIHTFWSPDSAYARAAETNLDDAIASTAAATAFVAQGKQRLFSPVSAHLVDAA